MQQTLDLPQGRNQFSLVLVIAVVAADWCNVFANLSLGLYLLVGFLVAAYAVTQEFAYLSKQNRYNDVCSKLLNIQTASEENSLINVKLMMSVETTADEIADFMTDIFKRQTWELNLCSISINSESAIQVRYQGETHE